MTEIANDLSDYDGTIMLMECGTAVAWDGKTVCIRQDDPDGRMNIIELDLAALMKITAFMRRVTIEWRVQNERSR